MIKCRFNVDKGGFTIPMTFGLFSINAFSVLTQTGKENDRKETSRKEGRGKEQRHYVLLIVTFTYKGKLT